MTPFTLLLHVVGAAVADSTSLCVIDAHTRVPILGAQVAVFAATAPTAPASLRLANECIGVSGDSARISRVGYRSRAVSLRRIGTMDASVPAASSDTLWVALTSVAVAVRNQLDTARIVASRDVDNSTIGATRATVQTTDARAAGASGANALLALLPYTNTRSARGETGLSLRGARREQVAVTLDGMPLNDPATGIADISDLPLAGLQSATVTLGADPVGAGSGATGGVLALTSAAQRVLSVRTGAFGQRQAEAAWHATSHGALWQTSAAWRESTNDFAFLNSAGESPQLETRINNDERRATVSAGVIGSRAQLSLLASSGERGMVGPANVRTYDADRSRTDRVLVRGLLQLQGTSVLAGVRRMQLRYRDPTRPALDSRAVAWASDAEWRGREGRTQLAWRVGGGADQLAASNDIGQRRSRGFVALQRVVARPGAASAAWSLDMSARADLIEGQGVLPTASLGVERRLVHVGDRATLNIIARAANAVRIPTLYDLYFSAPQRLFVRALLPERVDIDASVGLRGAAVSGTTRISVEGSLVARNTRDAIVWFPGNFGWSPANVGMERLRGAESRAELSSALLALSGWFTAYEATLSTGGLRIPTPYVPRLAGGAQLHLRPLAAPRVPQLFVVWRASGARPFTAGSRNPDFELPSNSLVDITLSQRLRALPLWPWPHADALLAFSLENATNVRWQSVRGFPSPGRSWAVAFTLQHSPR